MKTIRTEIIIDAPASKIWSILTDFDQYPKWNPFIKRISGEKKLQGKLRALIQPQGSKGMEFTPVVQKYEPNSEFQWLGSLGFRGIFDGKHGFKLVPLQDGKTLFIHSEQFTGLLVPLLWSKLHVPTRTSFEQMNEALKKRVENN